MLRRLLVGAAVFLSAVPYASAAPPHYTVSRLITEVAAHRHEAMPYMEPAKGAKHEDQLWKLVAIANHYGVEVALGADLDDYGLYGVYFAQKHIILLNPSLSIDGKFEVLLHEVTHLLTPMELAKPDDDVVAQAVAYIVSGELGLNDTDQTLYYYWYLQRDFDQTLAALMRNSKDIESVSKFLLQQLK